MFIKRFSFLLLPLLFIGFFVKSQERPEKLLVKNDWPNTVNAFGQKAEDEPSHYIFVVDISDKRFGEDIVKQIGIFAEALTKNDKISIIQLGPTDETKELVVTTDINEKILKEIKQKFQRLVSDGKFGTKGSDGEKMIKLILKKLKAPGTANSIPFVFIFSDLEYFPYKKYPKENDWLMLSQQFKQLKFLYPPYIKSFILENPEKNLNYVYKDYLNQIFPNMEIGDVSGPELLKKEFILIQAEILRKKILNCVNDKVKLQNANISLENKNGKIELNGADSLVYHKLVLNEDSEKKVAKILKSDKLFSFFPPMETEIEVSGTLIAEKYKQELPELSDINLNNQKVVMMPGNSKIPWWLTDVILFILAFSILRFIWTIIPPARLRGTIDFFQQGKSTEVFDCSGRLKKFSNNEVKILKSGFSLEVRATKSFFNGKCLILIPMNGDLLLSSRKQKKTARGGKKTIAKVKSQWNVDGVEITMPSVK